MVATVESSKSFFCIYTIRDLENKINILRKETMLKSYIYKNECEIECPISFFHIGTLHECAE